MTEDEENAASMLEKMARDRSNYAATVDPEDNHVGVQVRARRMEEEADYLLAGARALRVKEMLVGALLGTDLSGRECWCGADEGLGEKHAEWCLKARAALVEVRREPT